MTTVSTGGRPPAPNFGSRLNTFGEREVETLFRALRAVPVHGGKGSHRAWQFPNGTKATITHHKYLSDTGLAHLKQALEKALEQPLSKNDLLSLLSQPKKAVRRFNRVG